MEVLERKRLRRKQLLYLNGLMLGTSGVALILFSQKSDKVFFFTFAILNLIAAVLDWVKYRTGRYAWTSDMRKLVLYEKDVMDSQSFKKEQQSKYITRFVVTLMILVQSYVGISNRPPTGSYPGLIWLFIGVLILLIPLLNVGVLLRAKKVDEGNGYYEEIQKINWIICFVFIGLFALSGLVVAFTFNL